MNSYEVLVQMVKAGYKERIKPYISEKKKQKYIDRINHELKTIHDLGFDDYFLIVHDIVNFAVSNNIRVGPGRGSAAGSLVSYALGITQLDPIKYNLYFERFLNSERISAPDIDIDFSSKGRDKVLDYIRRKYGDNHVCQVVTYSKMNAKGLIRDLAKVMGVDPIKIEKIAKCLKDAEEHSVAKALETSEALQAYAIEYPELFEVAIQLNGCIKHIGKHAAGIIITKGDRLDSLPIMVDSHGKTSLSQWDKDALEEFNYLKIDILGLDTMDVIQETLTMIGKDVLADMPLDDVYVYSEYSKGNSLCMFQFETYGMRKILRKVQPDKLEDLSAVNALARPGAYEGLEYFIKGKETGEIYYFDDERLKPILQETFGTITYQEQTMALVQAVAGFTLAKADIVRRGIAKPKPGKFELLREDFVNGCIKNGQTKKWAENLFEIIKQGQRYAFNKSHSLAYAFVGYQTMYLKYYYPLEFMTRRLSNSMGRGWEKGKTLDVYEKEAQRLGIRIIDWDINTSKADYTCDKDENCIFRGLSAIKNVGDAANHLDSLKPFRNFEDFYYRVNKSKVRSDAIRALINVGCFDSIEDDRKRMSKWMDIPVEKSRMPDFEQKSLFEE